MKIALLTAIASACAAPALVAADGNTAPNGVIYVFDGDYAGGVSGTIRTDWDAGIMCDRVTVTADLSFKQVDLAALTKADGNCTGPVKEYAYHIHTLWNQPQDYQSSSASYAQCAKSITGNHYDPNKACGPASEYAGTPDCASRVQNYKCTPKTYAENVANCEMGDLSGKLGTLKPNKKGILKAKWTDSLYPRWDDHKPTWNIVIHAICGTATPRVACSVGHKLEATKKHLKGLKHHYDEGETETNGDDEDKDAEDDKDADDDKVGDDDEKDDQRDEDEDDDNDEDNDENNDDDTDGKDDADASDENPFGGIPHKGHDESTIVIKIYSSDDN